MSTTQPEKIPKRCQCVDCRAKLGVVPFSCRCGKYFCGTHRMAENHNCTYDYKAEGKKELLKYMSTPVVGEKVAII
jgi:predicted nucleic acid binding AN1-type Zn finger protein